MEQSLCATPGCPGAAGLRGFCDEHYTWPNQGVLRLVDTDLAALTARVADLEAAVKRLTAPLPPSDEPS